MVGVQAGDHLIRIGGIQLFLEPMDLLPDVFWFLPRLIKDLGHGVGIGAHVVSSFCFPGKA